MANVDAVSGEKFLLAELAGMFPSWQIWCQGRWYALRRSSLEEVPPGCESALAAATPGSLCAQLAIQDILWEERGGIDVPALPAPLGVHSISGSPGRAGT